MCTELQFRINGEEELDRKNLKNGAPSFEIAESYCTGNNIAGNVPAPSSKINASNHFTTASDHSR